MDNPPIRVKPYEHQVTAWRRAVKKLTWDNYKGGGYGLLMEMGTGKSLTTIMVMGTLYQKGLIRRVLVVAPSSVCPVWPKEMASYAGFPNICFYPSGTTAERGRQIEAFANDDMPGVKVAVVNYEATWRMEDALAEYDADMIVCDESQRIKNPTAKASKCMHRLGARAKYRMILTGTPVQNNPLDFWSQYRFLNPMIFGTSFYAFKARYAIMGGMRVNGKPVQIMGYRYLDELTEKAYRCAMRVRKDDCLDLPPKTFETRYVEMSDYEKRIYKQMQKDNIAFVGDRECTAQIVLTRLMILQRITGGFMRLDGDEASMQIGDSKLKALKEILEDYVGSEKVVVFVRFTDEYGAVCDMLNRMGVGYAAINGAVPLKSRGDVVNRFQTDSSCRVFVGQIEAAGTGITLTASGICVFYSPTWNYATYTQAQDRVHRIGATQSECHYIHLIAKGTVDEDVMAALEEKKNLADLVVDGTVKLGGGTK